MCPEHASRMCRDILQSCVRNTEEAEKATQNGSSGRGEAKGVWGMLEQSELAKSIREDDKKKVDEQLDVSSPRSWGRLTSLPLRNRPSPTSFRRPVNVRASSRTSCRACRRRRLPPPHHRPSKVLTPKSLKRPARSRSHWWSSSSRRKIPTDWQTCLP